VRLVSCSLCKSVEAIPDAVANPGSSDTALETVIMTHTERDPLGHGSVDRKYAPFTVAAVPDSAWEKDQAEVLRLLKDKNTAAGFEPWVYESVHTYADDALKCYAEHHRPAQGCIDWWSDSKRIGRPTDLGKQLVRDRYKLGERDPHLCQWCPVATYVRTEINFKKGLYKAG